MHVPFHLTVLLLAAVSCLCSVNVPFQQLRQGQHNYEHLGILFGFITLVCRQLH